MMQKEYEPDQIEKLLHPSYITRILESFSRPLLERVAAIRLLVSILFDSFQSTLPFWPNKQLYKIPNLSLDRGHLPFNVFPPLDQEGKNYFRYCALFGLR